MDCPPTPDRFSSGLQSLRQRLSRIACAVLRAFRITGWETDPRPVYAALQSRTYASGHYTITWLSEPGRYYLIEMSYDGGNSWIVAAAAIQGAPSPAVVTSWDGPSAPYQVAFFRILTLPPGSVVCYTVSGQTVIPGYSLRTDPLATLQ